MKTHVVEILPRQNDDDPVMNVKVKFSVPEQDHRRQTVEATVFIDKATKDIDEINRLAIEKAHKLLKTITDNP